MRKLLVGIALGLLVSIVSFAAVGSLRTHDEARKRFVVIFSDQEQPADYYLSAPEYEEGVVAVGETLRACDSVELHFVSRGTSVHGRPYVGVFLDELNHVQLNCVEDVMKEDLRRWIIEKVDGPIKLGLRNLG